MSVFLCTYILPSWHGDFCVIGRVVASMYCFLSYFINIKCINNIVQKVSTLIFPKSKEPSGTSSTVLLVRSAAIFNGPVGGRQTTRRSIQSCLQFSTHSRLVLQSVVRHKKQNAIEFLLLLLH